MSQQERKEHYKGKIQQDSRVMKDILEPYRHFFINNLWMERNMVEQHSSSEQQVVQTEGHSGARVVVLCWFV